MRYLANWIALNGEAHVIARGVERLDGHDVNRVTEGQLTVEATERVAARTGQTVVVISLVAVA